MFSNDIVEQKQLGRHIQGFNATEWNHARDALFQSILRVKFEQDYLVNYLELFSEHVTLAEASLRLDSDDWSGKNKLLGSMLMIVREELN